MLVRNVTEQLYVKPVTTNNDATAGGSGDNTKVTGDTLEKTGYDSCLLAILGTMTIADGESLSYAVEIQDSADNSTWNTATVLKASTAVKAFNGSSATDQSFTVPLNVDISQYDKYIRFNITPDLSASGTDTCNWGALATLGNGQDGIAPQSFAAIMEV